MYTYNGNLSYYSICKWNKFLGQFISSFEYENKNKDLHWGSNNTLDENSSILVYDAVSIVVYLPTLLPSIFTV